MRQTAKYTAGIKYARQFGFTAPAGISHQALYDTLEGAGHSWDANAKQWHDVPLQKSVFGNDDIPSGTIKIRIMAHPDMIEAVTKQAIEYLSEADWEVIEKSAPYPNRRGIGIRIYLTFKTHAY